MESSSQKQNTINNRIYSRNIPSQSLQPYLDSRPVLTKYSIMPIVDPRIQHKNLLVQTSTYNPEKIFNPGNDVGPWMGYASNINTETELRNQIYGLQTCNQSVYIPSSKSNLYNLQWNNLDSYIQQPFPDLFSEYKFAPFNPNPEPNKIGYSLFNNATRQQVKEL
jgi:hypothetical protein